MSALLGSTEVGDLFQLAEHLRIICVKELDVQLGNIDPGHLAGLYNALGSINSSQLRRLKVYGTCSQFNYIPLTPKQ